MIEKPNRVAEGPLQAPSPGPFILAPCPLELYHSTTCSHHQLRIGEHNLSWTTISVNVALLVIGRRRFLLSRRRKPSAWCWVNSPKRDFYAGTHNLCVTWNSITHDAPVGSSLHRHQSVISTNPSSCSRNVHQHDAGNPHPSDVSSYPSARTYLTGVYVAL